MPSSATGLADRRRTPVHTDTINRVVADLASHHHGLVCTRLTEPFGISRDHLHVRVGNGMLVQVDESIFRVAGAPVTWHQRALGSCWCHGPEALASHRLGGLLWKLDGIERAPF